MIEWNVRGILPDGSGYELGFDKIDCSGPDILIETPEGKGYTFKTGFIMSIPVRRRIGRKGDA